MNVKYYECHITVDPVFDERLIRFTEICALEKFRPAKLLMQKSKEDTGEISRKDTFATGHGRERVEIEDRMLRLLAYLETEGFVIRRYKIEAVILDVRRVTQS